MAWQKPSNYGASESLTLTGEDAREMRIIKQAILKSSIEGGVIKKSKEDTDDTFLSKWIKWVYRNTEEDKKLTTTDIPF